MERVIGERGQVKIYDVPVVVQGQRKGVHECAHVGGRLVSAGPEAPTEVLVVQHLRIFRVNWGSTVGWLCV